MSFVKIIRRTAAQFESGLILDDDQIGLETDTGLAKLGDGSTTWTNLGYFTPTKTVPTAAANDNDTSIASTAFVQGQGQGYLVYDATLTQTSTNAPVATVGQNNIGQTMTWAYVSPGVYTVTAGAAAFTANKTQIFIGSGNTIGINTTVLIQPVRTSTTVITINVWLQDLANPDNVATNALLTETAIRIVIFP